MKNSIVDLLTLPWRTCVVFTAVQLKIFTILSRKRMSVEKISSCCGADARLLKVLLDACVSMDLLKLENNKYENSDFSKIYLIEGEPQYVGDLIVLQRAEAGQWEQLHDILLGKDTVAEQPADATYHKTFYKAMNNLAMLGEAEAMKNAIDLTGCKSMVDAGGGSGLYSIVLCREYPDLKSTILDRREALKAAEEQIESIKEKNRIALREIDLESDTFGKEVDVVLLSDVVYDELEAGPILKNAWESLRQDGMLILRGYYADPEHPDRLFGSLFALGMIVFDPNRKIMTTASLKKNISDLGFTITKISPLTEFSWILIARK